MLAVGTVLVFVQSDCRIGHIILEPHYDHVSVRVLSFFHMLGVYLLSQSSYPDSDQYAP